MSVSGIFSNFSVWLLTYEFETPRINVSSVLQARPMIISTLGLSHKARQSHARLVELLIAT